MLRWLGLLLAIHGVLCMAWIMFDPPTEHTEFTEQGLALVPERFCSCVKRVDVVRGLYPSQRVSCGRFGGWFFVAAVVLLDVALAVAGVVLAYKVRNAGKGFEESKYTAAAVYTIVTISVLVAPIYSVATLDGVTSYLLICVAVLLAVTATMGLILVPKVAVCWECWEPHTLSNRRAHQIFHEWILMRQTSLTSRPNPMAARIRRAHQGSDARSSSRNNLGSQRGASAVQLSSLNSTHDSSDADPETEILMLRARVQQLERTVARMEQEKKKQSGGGAMKV